MAQRTGEADAPPARQALTAARQGHTPRSACDNGPAKFTRLPDEPGGRTSVQLRSPSAPVDGDRVRRYSSAAVAVSRAVGWLGMTGATHSWLASHNHAFGSVVAACASPQSHVASHPSPARMTSISTGGDVTRRHPRCRAFPRISPACRAAHLEARVVARSAWSGTVAWQVTQRSSSGCSFGVSGSRSVVGAVLGHRVATPVARPNRRYLP